MLRPLALLLGFAALADEPAAAPNLWMIGVLRMEGASADVEQAAAGLAATLRAVAETGRVGGLPAVRTEADKLHRLVLSAELATQNLAP